MSAPQAVIDTNILVSGLLNPAGPPGQVVDAIRDGRLVPVMTGAMLAEYREVLLRPRLRLRAEAVMELLDELNTLGVVIALPEAAQPAGLPDPDDWGFIACALASGCPVLTGNARHFPAGLGVRVMTAREWVEQAETRSSRGGS